MYVCTVWMIHNLHLYTVNVSCMMLLPLLLLVVVAAMYVVTRLAI